MSKNRSIKQILESALDANKHTLELVNKTVHAQQFVLLTAVSVGVIVGVGVALWVVNRSKPVVADADEAGNPLFV